VTVVPCLQTRSVQQLLPEGLFKRDVSFGHSQTDSINIRYDALTDPLLCGSV